MNRAELQKASVFVKEKRMIRAQCSIVVTLLILLLAAHDPQAMTLQDVQRRGELICGVSTGIPGFSNPDESGVWAGFDVDLCRAVAAAVLGDAAKTKLIPLAAQERLAALQSGEVDMLASNATWTLTRDTALGLHFAGINYYDGQGREAQALGGPDGPRVDCGSGAAGDARPWERPGTDTADGSVDPGDADLVRDAVATDIDRHTRTGGDVPAGLRRWAGERLQPVVDWHAELRAVVSKHIGQHAGRRDYTYRRPSRRRAPGVVLPGMVGHAPPSVAVVIDTSGSMQPHDLARALAETGDLVRRLGHTHTAVRVITCDAAANTVQTVRDVRQVQLVGGGGTDMAAGIEAALALKPRPDLVVVITDGWTPWPDEPVGVPVVAVLTQDDEPQDPPAWIRTIKASA